MYFGLMRVAAIVPKVKVADCDYNALQIIEEATKAANEGARVIVTPELGITGYTCGDLFHQSTLLDAAECALIATFSALYLRPAFPTTRSSMKSDGLHRQRCSMPIMWICAESRLASLPPCFSLTAT